MHSQKVRNLTGDEIRRGDRQAQDDASRDYHIKALQVMVDRFDEIVKAGSKGEAVTVFDQRGYSVTFAPVAKPDDAK